MKDDFDIGGDVISLRWGSPDFGVSALLRKGGTGLLAWKYDIPHQGRGVRLVGDVSVLCDLHVYHWPS